MINKKKDVEEKMNRIQEALRYVYRNNKIPELKNVKDIRLFSDLKEKGVIHESTRTRSSLQANCYNKGHEEIEIVWVVDTIVAEKLYGFSKKDIM